MNKFVDCMGREVKVGDHVAVAFSYSRSSVGWQKLGRILSLETEFRMHWDETDKVSPPMVFDSRRFVLLDSTGSV